MRAGLAAILYLACVVLPIWRVADGAGLYMLLAAVRPQDIPPYALTLAGGRFSILTLGCIVVGWALRVMNLRPRWGAFHLLLILLAAQMIVSRVYALDADGAALQFDMIFTPIVVSIILVQVIRTEDQIYRCLWWLAIGLGLLGYWAMWNAHVTNFYAILNEDGEITGPGGQLVDRNDFALGLCVGLPLLFYIGIMAKKRWAKTLAFVTMVPSAIIILETGSRGGFLGLAAVGSYILYKMHHKRWIFGLALVAVLGGLYVMPREYIRRITTIGDSVREDASAQGRVRSWNFAVQMARDRPLTGVGLGCFSYYQVTVLDVDPETALVAHSSFFQMLGTAGIPGAVLWVALVVRMWQVTGRTERRLKRARMKGTRLYYMALALRTSLIGYVVTGAFLSQEDLEFFYYELGLAAALDIAARLALQKQEAEEGAKPVDSSGSDPPKEGIPAPGTEPPLPAPQQT